VLGSGLSIYSTIQTAARMGRETKGRSKPASPASSDEDEA